MSTFLEDHDASVELRFLEASDGCSTYFPLLDVQIYVHLANRFSKTSSRWWFQGFFIFTHTWGNDPI